MTRGTFPRPLADVLAHPNRAICPTSCPYTPVCEHWRQDDINRSIVAGRMSGPEVCIWADKKWKPLVWGELGIVPTTSAKLLEEIERQLERDAITEEAS